MNKIFFVFLGIIIGSISTVIITKYTQISFNTNLSVNIVIAIATCIATFLHFNSIRQNKKNRIWDISKTVILDLTNAVHATIKEIENELDKRHGNEHSDPSNDNVYEEVKNKLEKLLNVYEPLIDINLLEKAEKCIQTNRRISLWVIDGDMDITEAYYDSLKAYQSLHQDLLIYIEKISGIKI